MGRINFYKSILLLLANINDRIIVNIGYSVHHVFLCNIATGVKFMKTLVIPFSICFLVVNSGPVFANECSNIRDRCLEGAGESVSAAENVICQAQMRECNFNWIERQERLTDQFPITYPEYAPLNSRGHGRIDWRSEGLQQKK